MSDRPAYTLHSLNGGELSRRFEARQDQNKYQSGVFKAENWTPLVLGGLKRRDGTIFVAETKYSGQEELVFADVDQVFAGADAVVVNEGGGTGRTTVLIPFIFNDEQAYMLEFGDLYVRFFKDGAPILVAGEPYELVTPYPSSMLRHIKMSAYQSADIMYIPSDGTLPMYKLRRIALDPDTFDIFAVNFKTPGSKESDLTGAELDGSSLTPGATSGDGVTFTASGAPFLAGDVGMVINGPFGASAIIDSFTSSSAVVADIIDPFVDTSPIAPADWSLSGTPSANINPSRAKHGGAVTVTADADVFRDAYLGRYILVYGGLIEITRVNGPQKIRGLIRSDLIDRDKINPSETGFWSLEENAWTEEDGYPTAGCFYQERMIVARQQTRWASNTAQFENFAKGNDDSAGFARTLSDDQINDIRWLKASTNGLFSATANGVYQAQASTEGGPLTPNDFNEKPISNLGTANIAPLRVEGTLLYVQESGRSLIEQAFNFIDNKFDSPDLLLRADHLTEFHTLTATAYQQKPDSIMVGVRNDGQLLQMVYRRKEDVVGWAPIVTEGTILDVAVIPRPETGHDWVWIVVEREIGGQTLTYIEYFEGFDGTICGREWQSVQTDSAMFTTATIVDDLAMAGDDFLVAGEDFVTLADGEAIGIIGLEHLEGKEVWPIGDGMLFNKALVTNGQITLAPQIAGINNFEVGIPYVSDGLTLEPVIPNEKGGPLMARGWEVAGARVRRTMGLSLNGERIPFRQATDNMDEQIPLKRGKVNVVVQKCDGEGRISFVQDLPFPAEVLNIMGRVSIGDEPIPFLIPEENLQFVECEPTSTPGADMVIFGHCLTPFMSAFDWSDSDGFGAKSGDPATLPENATADLAFNPAGDALGVGTFSAFVTGVGLGVWAWSNGFGDKFADPATVPAFAADVWAVAFSPSGQDIAFGTGDFPGTFVYPWSTAGFGVQYADASPFTDSSLGGIAFSPSGNDIVMGQLLGAHVIAFPWTTGVGYGVKYSNPGTAVPDSTRSLDFSPSGADLVIAHEGSPYVSAYPFASGFGAKYADPGTLPTGDGRAVRFSPSGADVAIAHVNSPYLSVYPWSAGFGVKYADPATLPGNHGISLDFSPSGAALVIGSSNPSIPLVSAYPWTTGVGFGVKYADPISTLPDDATATIFRQGV